MLFVFYVYIRGFFFCFSVMVFGLGFLWFLVVLGLVYVVNLDRMRVGEVEIVKGGDEN